MYAAASWLAAQGRAEDLVHRLGEDEGHSLEEVFGDVRQVFLVLLGQDHIEDADPLRRQDLLLEPADLQDAPAQRDLAGHGDIVAYRRVGEGGGKRGGHGDPGGRSVLRDRAGRHMDVEVVLGEDAWLDAELPVPRADVA